MYRRMLVLTVAIAAMAFAGSTSAATPSYVKDLRVVPNPNVGGYGSTRGHRVVPLPHIKEKAHRIARPVSEH